MVSCFSIMECYKVGESLDDGRLMLPFILHQSSRKIHLQVDPDPEKKIRITIRTRTPMIAKMLWVKIRTKYPLIRTNKRGLTGDRVRTIP